MAYAIPGEIPRSRYAAYATNPAVPFVASMFVGTLPAIVWMVANAWFLGCRDARRQTRMAVGLYSLVKVFGASHTYLKATGLLVTLAGPYTKLADFALLQANQLTFLFISAWLFGRQEDAAQYLSSVRKGLSWGLPVVLALLPIKYLLIPFIAKDWPYVAGLWGGI